MSAKGKIESGVKYVRRNFQYGLQGREPSNLEDLNAELRRWLGEVCNQRVHGTIHEHVDWRWTEEKTQLHSIAGRLPYP